MNDRVQRHLDGDLPREQLTEEELREVAAFHVIALEAAEAHRSIEVPDLTARVRVRLPADALPADAQPDPASAPPGNGAESGGIVRKAVEWIWAPRPVRLRPAYAMAAAALVTTVVLSDGALPGSTPTPEARSAATTGEQTPAELASNGHMLGGTGPETAVFIQFRLDAPDASGVRLAGSFTDWQPAHALHEMSPGVWSIFIPLEPGVHDYAFLVDDEEWVADPVAPVVDDGFGGLNSRLSVLLPDRLAQS